MVFIRITWYGQTNLHPAPTLRDSASFFPGQGAQVSTHYESSQVILRATKAENLCTEANLCTLHSAAAAAKSLQSCPTLCKPIDGSPTGPAVPGILQARTLEWVAISFSNA